EEGEGHQCTHGSPSEWMGRSHKVGLPRKVTVDRRSRKEGTGRWTADGCGSGVHRGPPPPVRRASALEGGPRLVLGPGVDRHAIVHAELGDPVADPLHALGDRRAAHAAPTRVLDLAPRDEQTAEVLLVLLAQRAVRDELDRLVRAGENSVPIDDLSGAFPV